MRPGKKWDCAWPASERWPRVLTRRWSWRTRKSTSACPASSCAGLFGISNWTEQPLAVGGLAESGSYCRCSVVQQNFYLTSPNDVEPLCLICIGYSRYKRADTTVLQYNRYKCSLYHPMSPWWAVSTNWQWRNFWTAGRQVYIITHEYKRTCIYEVILYIDTYWSRPQGKIHYWLFCPIYLNNVKQKE